MRVKIHSFVLDCSNSIVNAIELPQSFGEPSKWAVGVRTTPTCLICASSWTCCCTCCCSFCCVSCVLGAGVVGGPLVVTGSVAGVGWGTASCGGGTLGSAMPGGGMLVGGGFCCHGVLLGMVWPSMPCWLVATCCCCCCFLRTAKKEYIC